MNQRNGPVLQAASNMAWPVLGNDRLKEASVVSEFTAGPVMGIWNRELDKNHAILLMEEILHQLIGRVYYITGD